MFVIFLKCKFLAINFIESLKEGWIGLEVDLNSFIREVGRESRKVPARSTSVDDGAIRDQHRALSEECGAICKRNKVSSIELEVIHERCGAISRRRNATETK